MMAKWGFPDASAEVERLRVELEQARKAGDSYFHQAMENGNAAQSLRAENERLRVELEQARAQLREMALDVMAQAEAAEQAKAERDDLAARLQQIQQAERKYTAAKLTEAAKMRKGGAL